MPSKTCKFEFCQKPFKPTNHRQEYCSTSCRQRHWKKVKLLKRTCLTCGEPFQTFKKAQVYCSYECQRNRRSESKRPLERGRPKTKKECCCNYCKVVYGNCPATRSWRSGYCDDHKHLTKQEIIDKLGLTFQSERSKRDFSITKEFIKQNLDGLKVEQNDI